VIVLDASAVVEVLLHSSMRAVLNQRLHGTRMVHAPHVLDLEITSALRRHCALGSLTQDRGRQALEDFRNMRVPRHRHTPYLARIWEFRENFTAYDACYLALAETLDATLLTRDRALASARLQRGNVEVI
jgi:predicted nucleic acid-binding protein